MIQVTASRTVNRPTYQTFSNTVVLHGYDHLTPKAARGALTVAFGNSSYGDVWWTQTDPQTGETIRSYGYRVYANSHRKLHPEY